MSVDHGLNVLITGAGSGLGRQLALTFAAGGATIAATDISAEALQSLSDALGKRQHATVIADVGDADAMRQAVKELESRIGPPNIVIANAGIGIETSARAFAAEDMERIIRINLLGVINTIEAVLAGMIERNTGHIVAISSLASYRGFPKMAGYCAAKAGVNAVMDALRVELRGTGLKFTTVCPGWIRTSMTAGITLPSGKLMEVEVAAQRIVNAIRRQRPFVAFPYSQARRVRMLRWLPLGVSDWLVQTVYGKLERKLPVETAENIMAQ